LKEWGYMPVRGRVVSMEQLVVAAIIVGSILWGISASVFGWDPLVMGGEPRR